MSSIKSLTSRELWLGLGGVAIAFLFLWIAFSITQPLNIFLSFLGLIFIAFIIIDPLKGLFLLILIRPTLDIFTNHSLFLIGNHSLNVASFLAILAIFFALIAWIINLKKTSTIPLKKTFLFFILFTFLSVFYSINPTGSLIEWLRILSILSLYLLGFILIKNSDDFKKLIYIIIFSTLIPGIFAFNQFLTEGGMTIIDEGITNRIFGTFAHPNLFAYYLIIPLALLIFLMFKNEFKEKVDYFPLLFFTPIFTLLLLTYTRGAWLSFLIVILIFGALKYRKLLAGAILVLILIYFVFPPLHNRVNDLFYLKPGSSITWRINLWKDSLRYSQERIIAGYGIGTANQVILEKRGQEMGSPDPHNDYLKILLEGGLLGIISYLAVILSLIFTLLRGFVKSESVFGKNLYLLFLGITVALYIMSFADNILRNTALQWIFWVLLGGLFSAYSQPRLDILKSVFKK